MPSAIYPDLKARTALVTGGSSGIGFGIAEALLEQGVRVGIQYRSGRAAAEELAARYPGRAFALAAELGEERGCVALAKAQLAALGGCDVLVHSAGTWNDGPIGELPAARLEEMFRLNTFSAFYLVRELLPALRANQRGSIIFIGSTAGQRGEAFHSHYAASKGALQSLALSLAVELAPAVRTNMISPGWIRTPMAKETLRVIEPIIAPTMPNKRIGEVSDVVNAVLFLASECSSHLLGQDLGVSGGSLLLMPRGQFTVREE